jgi:hypothetical protein
MTADELRDTDYAQECKPPATLIFPGGGVAKLECLRFKKGPAADKMGYRFSWWKDGKMTPRPLDVTEDEFIELIRTAITQGVLTDRAILEMARAALSRQG